MLGLPRRPAPHRTAPPTAQRHPHPPHIPSRPSPERCASLFHYHKDNPYSTLVKAAKYRSRPSIGRHLGAMFADEAQGRRILRRHRSDTPRPDTLPQAPHARLQPDHAHSTRRQQGHRHSFVGDNLYAPRPHAAQARKRAEGRRINATGAFAVRNPEQLQGKHLLVVDDVITTGSTMVSALDTIKYAEPTVRLSVLSLALTY